MRIPRRAHPSLIREVDALFFAHGLDPGLHHLDPVAGAEFARQGLADGFGCLGGGGVEVVGVPADGVGVAGVGLAVQAEGVGEAREAEVAEGADVVGDDAD